MFGGTRTQPFFACRSTSFQTSFLSFIVHLISLFLNICVYMPYLWFRFIAAYFQAHELLRTIYVTIFNTYAQIFQKHTHIYLFFFIFSRLCCCLFHSTPSYPLSASCLRTHSHPCHLHFQATTCMHAIVLSAIRTRIFANKNVYTHTHTRMNSI